MDKFLIVQKEIDTMYIDELKKDLIWLFPNSKAMYEIFGELNRIFKPHCHNDGKKWNNAEKENVKRFLIDPFSPLSMSGVVIRTGRTPFSIFNVWVEKMWEAVDKSKKGLLKKALKSAVRYGYAEWALRMP